MSAIYSLPPLKIIGIDICEKCFLRDQVTERVSLKRKSRICVDCAVKDMNKNPGKLKIGSKIVEIGHIERGSKPGEIIAFEKLLVGS